MKKYHFIIICLFCLNYCLAQQDTVERKNRLTDSVLERFQVLKNTPQVKNGLYRALFQRKIPVAVGRYKDNEKIGIWNFYKQDGKLIQRFNYDKNALIYENMYDADDDVHYILDKKYADTDRATRPIKIGGIYYGIIPYLSVFRLPFETIDVNTNSFRAAIELLISPLGRLADYKVRIVSDEYEYDRTFNLDVNLFSEADRMFIPATVNNEPVVSRIVIKCFVQRDGGLDFF